MRSLFLAIALLAGGPVLAGPIDHSAAVVAMAKKLKLDVVAEGVETQRQLEVLRELGCDRYQGYLFSPAVAPEEFAERFLAAVPA